jgi:hypothetical protein
MSRPQVAVTNPKVYNQSFSGNALKLILLYGSLDPTKPVNPQNIMARCTNFQYRIPTPVTQPDEINTESVQETNYTREELGSGTIEAVFTLNLNDNMPNFNTIREDQELTALEVSGDNSPLTVNGVPTILNAFLGVRIVDHGSTTALNQNKSMNVQVVFRQKLPGAQWKLQAGGAVNYPATVTAGT